MKKNDAKKKGGMGNRRHHRFLWSWSVSDPMLCATFTYPIMSMVTSKPNFYFLAKLVNNYIYNVSRRHLIIISISI